MKLYFYALTDHFGSWVESAGLQTHQWQVRAGLLYGQLIKYYRRRCLVRVERRALLGSLDQLAAALRALGESGTIQTDYVERLRLRRDGAPGYRRTDSSDMGRRSIPSGVTAPSPMVARVLPFHAAARVT